jgi:N utilization substance protein B
MSRRSRAREVALQVLYQDDLNPGQSAEREEAFLKSRLRGDAENMAFARAIVAGVREKRTEIDAALAARATNWSLSRMAATDRNVLRLGAWEALYSETPAAVAIDEAIELAKRYGDRRSPSFVNGILDRISRQDRSE